MVHLLIIISPLITQNQCNESLFHFIFFLQGIRANEELGKKKVHLKVGKQYKQFSSMHHSLLLNNFFQSKTTQKKSYKPLFINFQATAVAGVWGKKLQILCHITETYRIYITAPVAASSISQADGHVWMTMLWTNSSYYTIL